ncbi:MAG: serine/threonine protein kinase, partial [Proteobacteria bacterium]|nr:serine/threonine protein kinase [Pseudomonadota bacterium]
MTVAFEELIDSLQQEGVANVEEHVAAFRRADTKRSAHSDPDRLLAYLYAANVIDEQQYRSIHSSEIARVTDIAGLRRGGWAKGSVQRRYSPVGLIGSGSMGKVYVARESDLNRKVAFKQISSAFQSDEHLMRRFVAEVQITAQLNHPNVVPVYGLEATPEGSLGYAMKLVQGQTLEEIINDAMDRYDARQPVSENRELKERLDYFVRVCDAVAYAHTRGVVHGDLKPANIMVGSFGKIYVMDWGLARLISSEDLDPENTVDVTSDGETSPAEEEGQAIGTPAYMSPEQARGLDSRLSHLDSKSDQYALGLILQELVTLWPAIDGETTDEVMKKAGSGFRNPFKHLGRG